MKILSLWNKKIDLDLEDYEIKIFDQNNSENLILNLKEIVKEFNRESKYHILVFLLAHQV